MRLIGVFVIMIFLCSGVFAISGVSPASYEIDFEPGYKGEFVFDFVFEEDGSADLYAEGDLADYVSFDKKSLSGMDRVVVSLDLPSEMDSPGVNYVRIGARNGAIDIGGFIKINVFYPEKYVEVGLNAPNTNVGEEVFFELELFGRGNESVVVSPRIEIYKDGEEVDVISVEDVEIFFGDEAGMNISLDTEGYSAGSYLAIAFVDYDGESVSVKNPFRIGEFSVRLIDYTKYFRANKVNRFDILVESLWDDDMSEVYAEVNILGFESVNFVTSSEDLLAWENQVLVGFLDMSEIEGDSFEAEIVLHYGDEATSEIIELKVIEEFDWVFWAIVLIVVVGLGFLVWRSMVFVQRFNKHKIKKR